MTGPRTVAGTSGRRDRAGLLVALLGPDGAGKTTLIRRLEADPELNARSLYMGRNPHVRRTSLPAPRWLRRHRPGSDTRLPPGLAQLSKALSFGHLVLEQWLCYAAALVHERRGRLVLFDRWVYDLEPPNGRRTPGIHFRDWLLHLGAPEPDLVIILDAEPELLHARKPEHDLPRLERMRQGYAEMAETLDNAVVVDASQDAVAVADAVRSLIRSHSPSLERAAHPAPTGAAR